jgi:NAD(P)-dependent dehydrogenase (short-subunit alcohol dehydrogenase family)
MTGRLAGKVAIVTGATRGIGQGIAAAFVREGAKVLFTGRDIPRGQEVERELGPNSRFLAVDVTQEGEMKTMVAKTVELFGAVDCLVNNAGEGFQGGAVADLDSEKFWKTFHVLVGSVAYGMKHAAPEIAKRGGGTIVNISSIAASNAGVSGYSYSAAKAAMLQMSKWAAMDLAPQKIRVNAISPGPILTAIFGRGQLSSANAAEQRLGKVAKVFEELTPLHLAGEPTDIAEACVYFASPESRYVTGQDLTIDGGLTNGRSSEEMTEIWTRIREAAAN